MSESELLKAERIVEKSLENFTQALEHLEETLDARGKRVAGAARSVRKAGQTVKEHPLLTGSVLLGAIGVASGLIIFAKRKREMSRFFPAA